MIITQEPNVPALIWEYTEHRITQATKNTYTKWPCDERIIMVARDERGDILGCAAVSVAGNSWYHAFVIVHREHRNKGIGTALLRARIVEQHKMLPYVPHTAQVAADNIPSVLMCQKANMIPKEFHVRERNGGCQYMQTTFSEAIA